MTFSVEIANIEELPHQRQHIEIYIDRSNLKSLIARLKKLAEKEQGVRCTPLSRQPEYCTTLTGLEMLLAFTPGRRSVNLGLES